MADLDAVNLGLDENEADIAEELQDFEDSFDTRSEASAASSSSSATQPSISSVSTDESSDGGPKSRRGTNGSHKGSGKKTVVRQKRASSKGKSPSGTGPKAKKLKSNETSRSKESPLERNPTVDEKKSAMILKKPKIEPKSSGSDTDSGRDEKLEKRNGRKANSKSKSRSKSKSKSASRSRSRSRSRSSGSSRVKRNSTSQNNTHSSGTTGDGKKNKSSSKSYDYMTKLNYLFRDTRFFLIKSNNADNIALSKNKNVWSTLPQNETNLNQAFKESRNVLLIFSVNESGRFAGFARMNGPSRRDLPQVAWVLPPSISLKSLGGVFEIDWICQKELSFTCTAHLYNSWNDGKPVKIGRDGQEIEPKVGAELCRLFPEDEDIEMTPILRKSKETAKIMREKGIHTQYKIPSRSIVSMRGGHSRGHGGTGHGGPIRNKRHYIGGPRHHHKMGGPPPPMGGYKRSSPPYSRSDRVPPWERYMTSAAAAEAYVADYMRTMHGQLPPLPFAPPFSSMMPGAPAVTAPLPPPNMPPPMYEQIPPPVRYYDGPPLPDYPPPQPTRPPPPSTYEKHSGYEESSPMWKIGSGGDRPSMPIGINPPMHPFSAGGVSGGGSNTAMSLPGAAHKSSSNGGNTLPPNAIAYRNREFTNRNRERGGRDYHRGGGTAGVNSRSGDRDRQFRDRNTRSNYRDRR